MKLREIEPNRFGLGLKPIGVVLEILWAFLPQPRVEGPMVILLSPKIKFLKRELLRALLKGHHASSQGSLLSAGVRCPEKGGRFVQLFVRDLSSYPRTPPTHIHRSLSSTLSNSKLSHSAPLSPLYILLRLRPLCLCSAQK